MKIIWTETQARRLKELDVSESDLNARFESASVRELAYQELEKKLTAGCRRRLKEFREIDLRPGLCRLESKLTGLMVKHAFVQIATPIIMSKGMLSKMSIDSNHPLNSQVFWLGNNKCLRPMLAPHLYFIMKDLLRLWDKPIRFFEVGPCFRKESQGSQHANEFTMLNLVEIGLPAQSRHDRITELATMVVEAAGINDYTFETVKSEIYGDTIDIVAGKKRIEVASGAMGPHPLDRAWKINTTWVGIGFGLERLLMVSENSPNLKKMGRSLAYLDGIRLNIQ
ncbi:pyrrolysine--tRNA(Pyl) ligase large subunit [Desulfococcaceae bacterium HSG9]|nr:pyrrolysine--tRNA(Pyl) ligase large subunit [Desulfococcaceae bacterium HSG9]